MTIKENFIETVSTNIARVTQEHAYKEFIRLGMKQTIAQSLSKSYFHDDLTYRDLKNLEKIFNLRFDRLDLIFKDLQKDISNLDAKIDSVEKTLQKDISNLNAK